MSRHWSWRGSRSRLALLMILSLPAIFLLAPACSDDDDDDEDQPEWLAPAEMEGSWHFTIVLREHESQEIVDVEDDTEVICEGDPAVVDVGQEGDCDLELTDDGFITDCEQTEALPIPDCDATTEIHLELHCTADTITGTGWSIQTYDGSGCGGLGEEQLWVDITVEGEKTGPAPSGACDGKSLRSTLWEVVNAALPRP